MTGSEFKEKITAAGISVTSLSKKLGMSPQGLSNVFATKDVKSGLIEKTADVLNMSVAEFYEGRRDENKDTHDIACNTSEDGRIFNDDIWTMLKRKDKQIDALIRMLADKSDSIV